VSSLDRILPFLRPIEDLLRDPAITEVMVNCGGRRVFVERAGQLQEVPDLVLDERNLKVAIKNIAPTFGDEISDLQPIPDSPPQGCPRGSGEGQCGRRPRRRPRTVLN